MRDEIKGKDESIIESLIETTHIDKEVCPMEEEQKWYIVGELVVG